MITTSINLLPPRKKDLLEKLTRFLFFKDVVEIVLLVVAFLATTLLWSWFALQNQFNDLTKSALLINREYSHYNQDIKKINNTINEFNLANKNFFPLSPKIFELLKKIPNDIKLNSISLNRQTGQVVINGTALTRDALLKYQASLVNFSWLEEIQTPTSQLFQKENTSFEIKAKTKGIPLFGNTKPKKTPGVDDSRL